MRILLAALALLLGAHLAQAAVLTNVTNLSFDPGHGTQIEYVAPNDTSFLWYPGNTMVLPGRWNTVPAQHGQAAQICFDYGPRSYNPVTRVYGGSVSC